MLFKYICNFYIKKIAQASKNQFKIKIKFLKLYLDFKKCKNFVTGFTFNKLNFHL